MMNITVQGAVSEDQDPLRLSELQKPEPTEGSMERDWEAVSAALDAGDRERRNIWIGTLAMAASVLFVIALISLRGPEPVSNPGDQQMATQVEPGELTPTPDAESQLPNQPTTGDLISMSQSMERQLQAIRSQVGTMPSKMVVYQVELQDLIGQVDDALSLSPDSHELWGQRVELQMDLMKLYRNQLRRDYHRIASV